MLHSPDRTRRESVLLLLAQAGFATRRHLEEAGIVPNATKPGRGRDRFIADLEASGAIYRVRVGAPYGIGWRVAYYLTRRGAEAVEVAHGIELKDCRYGAPDGNAREVVRADFPHKEAYVSALIALARHFEGAGYVLARALHYYDRKRGGTALSLKGRNFCPDGLLFAEPREPGRPAYAYALEVHRHSDRQRIVAQLKRHAEAFIAGSFRERFGGDGIYFVFSIYAAENARVMAGVIEELKKDAELWPVISRFFIFAELESMKQGLKENTAYFGGAGKPFPA